VPSLPPTAFTKRIEIRWRDMDAFKHVNNAVYLTYLEEMRDEWFLEVLGNGLLLNDFVLALNTAGAGAIVGTEVTIFTGLAERFASDVTRRMWSSGRSTLGEAVKEFRQTLATESNPLGFAFTSYGSADLRVV